MTGQIIASLADSHEGFLKLNGQSIPKMHYPQLYALIGDQYGSTATEFNLPPMHGLTLIGASAVPAKPVGQLDGSSFIEMCNLPSYEDIGNREFVHQGNSFATNGNIQNLHSSETATHHVAYFPANLRVNFFIKY